MNKTNLPYALTFLSGLLLGWLAIGWWLWPVAYVGEAYTYELNQADRMRYAQGAVDEFTLTGQVDPDWFAQWTPEEVSQALAQVAAQPNRQAAVYSLGIRLGIAQANPVQAATVVPLTVKLAKAQANQVEGVGLPDWMPYLAFAFLGIGLVGGGLWVGYSAIQAKAKFEAKRDFGQPQRYATMTTIDYIPTQAKPSQTLAHARLTFGPDQPTDQHLPIERERDSLGEFGVNQVDDQPAWDVWLFDQQALVTVTKVLADRKSEELASRGEVIGWDGPFLLETPNLKMTGKASMVEAGLQVELTVEGKDAE